MRVSVCACVCEVDICLSMCTSYMKTENGMNETDTIHLEKTVYK